MCYSRHYEKISVVISDCQQKLSSNFIFIFHRVLFYFSPSAKFDLYTSNSSSWYFVKFDLYTLNSSPVGIL